MTTAQRSLAIQFYSAEDAVPLDEDGMMSMPVIEREIYETYDMSGLVDGQRVTVLFKGDGPDGLSLVRAEFGAGFRLPRHSHSADCLYFVVRGEAHMGARVVRAGDGFFVRADAPYTYTAGPHGVEVLEFRSSTNFDMKIYDQTVERWKPIIDAISANRETWLAEKARA